MTDLYRLLPEEMEEMIIELGEPRFRADQILYSLYYKFPKNISEIKQLPKEFREKLLENG
ncbi:MAG: 23S rRNA (adenine(2503)-C(2))-methyltransferase RlmN, partial [Candidatus Nitrosomaritimum yanchengensis]